MREIQRTLPLLCLTYLIFSTFINLSEATICKPKSTFSLDCNACRCSADGLQYSCTNDRCPPPNPGRFIEESLESGYVLLRPKASEKNNNEDEFVLRRKLRQNGPLAAYLNDEIPISNENSFNGILQLQQANQAGDNNENERNADFFLDNYADDNSADPDEGENRK